ncbi:MAG: rod shape-determining protein MreC [Melioribacteraceae bacterium]|jgi:rod shape-determining protein MreC|nr:rod shape-determining protein MreC [Melioribacteraceae bacterium]
MINSLRRFIYQFKEYFLVAILIIISLSLLSSNDKPGIKKLRTFALGNFAVLSEMVNSVTNIFTSEPSYSELKSENAKLMLELNRLRKKGLENNNLRSMLALEDTSKYKLIAADVISKLVNRIQGNFILNKGIKDNIKIGMPVIAPQGLVGIISEVTDNYSVAKMLFNSSLNIAVTLQRINVDGILSWNGRELIIKNIPTTYEIEIGDGVETSDFSSLFPPNIPIGIVSKKEEIALGLLHTLSVQPFADIRSLGNLFIVQIVPSIQINQLEMNLIK